MGPFVSCLIYVFCLIESGLLRQSASEMKWNFLNCKRLWWYWCLVHMLRRWDPFHGRATDIAAMLGRPLSIITIQIWASPFPSICCHKSSECVQRLEFDPVSRGAHGWSVGGSYGQLWLQPWRGRILVWIYTELSLYPISPSIYTYTLYK